MNHKQKNIQKICSVFIYCILLSSALRANNVTIVPSTGIFSTITAAMLKAKVGDTVIADDGVYREHIYIKAGVTLKSRNMHRAVLNGKGRGTVVTMGSNSTISGFTVTNGTIGIFTKSGGISILRCLIKRNSQTGIITVRQLPTIEDNLIVYNSASGIQGWDVRATVSAINHNTIAYNGNHGIAVGGTSAIVAENNVIAFNERYAIKLSHDVERSKIAHNNFYHNLKQVQKLPEGNYSFDPSFVSPRTALNFNSDPSKCCEIKASDNQNLGARLYKQLF